MGWGVEVREKQPVADGSSSFEGRVMGGRGGVEEAGALNFKCLDVAC